MCGGKVQVSIDTDHWQKIGSGVREMVTGGAHFGFRPSESYLAGKKRKADKGKDENQL
jgi:hypothetical protein